MSEVTQRTKGEVEVIAASMGLECFLPERNEILIDLDHGELNERVIKCLADNDLEVMSRLETVSKGGKRHVYLRLTKPLRSDFARIAIQACLSSDPVREVLSVIRALQGSENPTALFETKLMAKKVRKWRAKDEDRVAVATEADDDIPY